ncbi:MAG: phosphoribosylamine--glycine ligase [Sulfobacillus acidophilus]|uniref:phosphoribosylamine--glycine ligase n=1 Tax=Sulfobacillus acidophilus TaxID=53633 RepID=A0A2T2WG87_9FIRM|nr:MAG: phosphoribosylamine--glycine ligase [Sulfobacillus acidophilus]
MNREAVVIGSGGREHALAQGLKSSGISVWAIPGNGGINAWASTFSADTPHAVIRFFGSRRPLIVIGPEAPLADGWADVFRAAGFLVVGPSAAAARLESSKRLAKAVMLQYGIPTAKARTAFSAAELADWVEQEQQWPKVLKQSGLAQGKGVRVVTSREQAHAVLQDWQSTPQIWSDGVLWEDHVEGYEVSAQVVTNGRDYCWLPPAQDYKRLTPDPDSPNTGGMGAKAPVFVDARTKDQINREIWDPMMHYLRDNALDYRGVLYAGLMMTRQGPVVLEFNVRLGDPETQVIVPLLDVDWYEFWLNVSQGQLPSVPEAKRSAVGVVMAAPGYPDKPQTGLRFRLGDDLPDTMVYYGASSQAEDGWENRAGRVLTVVGLGNSLDEARQRAYARVQSVDFPHAYYRPDIGL